MPILPLTHALVAGSPAIDAVTGTCPPPADDRRGELRPQGPACDIGSVEVMAAPSPDLAVGKTDSPDPVAVSDHLSYTLTVNNAGEGDATSVTLTNILAVLGHLRLRGAERWVRRYGRRGRV